MNLPEIGDKISTERGLQLCAHFNLDYLIERIESNREDYNPWVFDGVSGLPESLAAMIGRVDQSTLTYQCALPHDLGYAYGEPGNEMEKEQVDLKFKSDLLNKARMDKLTAELFHTAVRIGGREEFGLPFTWAFAHKHRKTILPL